MLVRLLVYSFACVFVYFFCNGFACFCVFVRVFVWFVGRALAYLSCCLCLFHFCGIVLVLLFCVFVRSARCLFVCSIGCLFVDAFDCLFGLLWFGYVIVCLFVCCLCLIAFLV